LRAIGLRRALSGVCLEMKGLFIRFTTGCARFTGQPLMLFLCVVLCLTGVMAEVMGGEHLASATNLAINIVTLLLLPILQATQNRDGAALQAKLDELIKSNERARDAFIGLENRGAEEIEQMRAGGGACDRVTGQ
jgi:low affinity Fe/Cu permease